MNIVLKKGKEKSLLRKHPWVFSGAVARFPQGAAVGSVVDVVASNGEFLGRGFYSPNAQLVVRILSFDKSEEIDKAFLKNRISAAWSMRANRWDSATHNAVRILHGESDGLPGLIADRFVDVISIQILSAGFEAMRKELVEAFQELFPECRLYERSDTPMRALEGLEERTGPLAPDFGSPLVEVSVDGVHWLVDVEKGQKTGCYLDQVDNWQEVGAICNGADVLDTFCYNGGFTLYALKGGAKTICSIDSSEEAIENVKRNVALNGFDESRLEVQCADVFAALRKFRDSRRTFDVIILDPPKFADSKGHVERACRAYKDINLLAFKLLRPGGYLATYSCSGSVMPELFQKVVADAALDSKRIVRMERRFMQAPDHPVAMSFPEGLYLKGILCHVE